MRETVGVIRYEYLMQIRRWGLWISLLLTVGLFAFLLIQAGQGSGFLPSDYTSQPWRLATIVIEKFNLFAPIAAGILVADRFTRDRLLGASELLSSSLLSRLPLVLGKCAGSVLAILTPPCVLLLGMVAFMAARYHQPGVFLAAPVVLLAVVVCFGVWSPKSQLYWVILSPAATCTCEASKVMVCPMWAVVAEIWRWTCGMEMAIVMGMTVVLKAPRLSVTISVTSARPGMVNTCVTCCPMPSGVASPKFQSYDKDEPTSAFEPVASNVTLLLMATNDVFEEALATGGLLYG